MDNDKNTEFDENVAGDEGEFANDTSTRARNRTVMLTPEITGEVRARLQQDLGQQGAALIPGASSSPAGGAARTGSSYVPGGVSASPNAGLPNRTVEYGSAPSGPTMQATQGEGVHWSKQSPIIGFLVSYDVNPNGIVYELRAGRLIVTSEAPGTGDFLVVNDESVSPMHAIMRISAEGEIQVLDQLSEYGTRIYRADGGDEIELSGDKGTIDHGDMITFGSRSFYVCVVPKREEQKE